ncbi:Inositol polyphosphate 5-phosphatase K-like protein, partial [Leptotrombidium deliense]
IDSKKGRSRRPAFTDRILYRVNPHVYNDVKLHMNQLEYASHYEYKQSDHKPVTSLFSVKIFTKLAMNKLHLEEPINVTFPVFGNWCVYRDATVWYRVSCVRYYSQSEDTLNERENFIRGISSFDWIALYKSDFTSLDDYVCYTWASCSAHLRCPEIAQEIPSTSHSSQSAEIDSSNAGERWFKVTFPDQSLLISGSYQLVYITQNGSVLGMSAPFNVESQ